MGEQHQADALDLPYLFHAADQTSEWAQTRAVRFVRWELGLVLAGAVVGLFNLERLAGGSIDPAGVIAALAFTVALFVKLQWSSENPEAQWFKARAAAESIKTLAWRYAVCAPPFPYALTDAEADELFVGRVRDVIADMGEAVLGVQPDAEPEQITATMRSLRAADLATRRDAYQKLRIRDQQRWYTAKSALNTAMMRRWRNRLLVVEIVGIVAGVSKAFGFFPTDGLISWDVLGLAAAGVAAISAWTKTRQHDTLASSYAVAAQELATIGALLPHQTTEESWEEFVETAEGAVSREHTSWRARRKP